MEKLIIKSRVSMERIVSELVLSGYTVTVRRINMFDKENNVKIHPFEIYYEETKNAAV